MINVINRSAYESGTLHLLYYFMQECTMGNHWEAEIEPQAVRGPEDYLGSDDWFGFQIDSHSSAFGSLLESFQEVPKSQFCNESILGIGCHLYFLLLILN